MIHGPHVVDASVVVEYLIDRGQRVAAKIVFDSAGDGTADLWAPDLVYLEVVSAVRKLRRMGHLDEASASTAVSRLVRLPLVHVGVKDMTDDLWDAREAMTPYDATYVVLARRLSAPLVTADQGLARAHEARSGRAILLAELT
jgi:predicted nucleic acid-binding protein